MHFGLYLKKKGIISAEQLVAALEAQLETLPRIGQLALEEGIISPRDIFDVLQAQRSRTDVRFGDLAIEMGLMTRNELIAVPRHSCIDRLVIGVGDRHERDGARLQRLDGRVDIGGGERDVLDALAVIGFEIFGDLRFVVGALVDRDADPPARAGHRL